MRTPSSRFPNTITKSRTLRTSYAINLGRTSFSDSEPAHCVHVHAPEFHPDYRVHTAYMQTDYHSERRVLDDMVISTTFLLRLALRGLRPRKSSQRLAVAHSLSLARQRRITVRRTGERTVCPSHFFFHSSLS
ncbi:hypothetical protein BC826DRAFT_1176351 [Russula brevipes]|nr:hypothetical protein BC826DRAFT_1176351 [Russula brevipes]